jgi:adenosylhomocysteine nucleosidase
MIRALCLAVLGLLILPASAVAEKLDTTPRTVVMTAYEPEWNALIDAVEMPVTYQVNGLSFTAGVMSGKPILLMQSGISMVNAAMNTQLVLDRFAVKRIVFSGIAGGVDPAISIGDVFIADRWGQYLEVNFARQGKKGWISPEPVDPEAPAHWSFIYPRGVLVGNAAEPPSRHYVFAADRGLIDLARKLASTVTMDRCVPGHVSALPGSVLCLPHAPKIVIGGTGVSAGVYADNAAFRTYLATAWKARVLDMESAAVIQVAFANEVPAIVFRSVSDLAGGDASHNMEDMFERLAAVNSARVVRSFVAALPD